MSAAGLGARRARVLGVWLVVVGLAGPLAPAAAPPSQGGGWSAPYQLSTYQNAYSDGRHAVASDAYGYVHAFWIETMPANGARIIQYSRFDGQYWSHPVNIHITGSDIDRLAATVDDSGTLHLIWTQGISYRQNPIFYRHAPAHDALAARQWSDPQVIRVAAHLLALQVGWDGRLHLIYTEFFGSYPGVYYIYSTDAGQTWSQPAWLDPDIPPLAAPDSLEFKQDEAGRLHASWFYTPIEAAGGDWVRYTRSVDGGTTWAPPVTIDRDWEGTGKLRAGGPILAVGRDMVHIVWAAGELNYRNHRFSTDAGETWTAPARIFGDLNGQAGDSLIVDGNGQVHFLGQIRYPQGIYHATWNGERWNRPALIYLIRQSPSDPIGARYHAHILVTAVRQARQLVLLFFDNAEQPPRQLYTMHTTLAGADTTAARPTPTTVPALTPTTTTAPAAATATRTPVPGLADGPPPGATDDPTALAAPMWIGAATALLVAGVVVLIRQLRLP